MVTTNDLLDVSVAALQKSSRTTTAFWGRAFSALTATLFRLKGPPALSDLWFTVLTGHQAERYVDGLKKLGIVDDPPAVAAAKYHFFTNLIGGLDMEYIEESPRKVWIRYRAPMWMYEGVAMMALPGELRRRILGSWHPRNGIYMNEPRLGYVGTKFVMEGDPYDEGYFLEYDHDLSENERMRYEVVSVTPEFNPKIAPKLDPALWPEARILKARTNFSIRYATTTVHAIQSMFGEQMTATVVSMAMRMLAVQYTPLFRELTEVGGNSVEEIADVLSALLQVKGSEFAVQRSGKGSVSFHLSNGHPLGRGCSAELAHAFFEFPKMFARMVNGHIRVEQQAPGTKDEKWIFEDVGHWLW